MKAALSLNYRSNCSLTNNQPEIQSQDELFIEKKVLIVIYKKEIKDYISLAEDVTLNHLLKYGRNNIQHSSFQPRIFSRNMTV